MQNFSFPELRERCGFTIDEVAEKLGYSKRHIYRLESGEILPKKPVLEMLLREAQSNHQQYTVERPHFSFIDLFAGIGGLRRGFENLGGECVFTSEWNKYSQQTYKANYPMEYYIHGDITKILAEEIPSHDLLLAGFPCQPFSIAGVSKKNSLNMPHGFHCETQGTLFFDIARIIEHHQPKAFLLENVKNLLNHDKGKTFRIIRQTLEDELGYQIHTRIIDAKSWVPQHRERIFIVGFRESNSFDFDMLKVPDPLLGPKLESILHPQDGSEEINEHNRRYLDKNGMVLEKYTLSDKLWNYLQAYAEKHRRKGNGFGYGLVGFGGVARTLSARYYKDGSEILIEQGEGKNPRRLTPRECARLMGFDSPRESSFVIPVSDTQAYKQFGNAVVVPVVKAVAEFMLPYLPEQGTQLAQQLELIPVG